MKFVYPAQLRRAGPDEVVVSFRDLPECLTSGADEAEALSEAQDALEEAVAGRIDDGEPIPTPSLLLPGERTVAVPSEMAAKVARALTLGTSCMTRVALVDLLKRGFFPKELPPPFTTEPLGSLLEGRPSLIATLSHSPSETGLARHSLAQAGSVRRRLSVPNPLVFIRLSQWFEQNWTTVENQCKRSPLSLSGPRILAANRAVGSATRFSEQPEHQAALRAASRYILKTDITSFYPSIYTHSIPWALHSKAVAKANRGPNALLGNQLDKIVREGQYGQTMGIPIGPDTSFIIAEMLLSSVDEEFFGRMQKEGIEPRGFRSYDDFEFGFTTRAESEAAVASLQRILSDYELQLNPRKTAIIELPVPLEAEWVSELRTFGLDDLPQNWGLRRYFDRAFELSRLNRDSEVLKYAIRRLRSVKIVSENWRLCEDLVLQCAMVEPSALPAVVDHLHHYREEGFPLDLGNIREVFNILIGSHAPLGHGSEVAWILWGCLLFDLRIGDAQASSVTEMEDPFVALLMLHARELGLTYSNPSVQNWKAALTDDGLRDSQWVLSYEAYTKGWMSASDDYVSRDGQFGVLKQHGVSFYDDNKVSSHTPSKQIEHPSGGLSIGGYPEE